MPGLESAKLVLGDVTYLHNSEKLKESQHILSYLNLSLTKKKHPSFLGIWLMTQDNIHSKLLKKLNMELFLTLVIRRSELLPASFSQLSTNFENVTHAFCLSSYNCLWE